MTEIAAPGAMTTLDPKEQKPQDIYKLLVGSVVPRPIAFVFLDGCGRYSQSGAFQLFHRGEC